MKNLFYSMVLALCWQSNLSAQETFYVSSSGSDDNPGTKEQPWYSLNADNWTDGCTIIVLDEIYLDPVIDVSKEATIKEVTIKGGTPEAAIMGVNDDEFNDGEMNVSSFFDLKRVKLNLEDITLKNLHRDGGTGSGGMIYVDPYSELNLNNVVVRNGVVTTGVNCRGGAICSEGKLVVKKSIFEGCKAYQGGAVCLRESENPIYARFEDCIFRNNETGDGVAENGSGAAGGALYIEGMEMDIAFDKCYFDSNVATNTARNATGGGIRLFLNEECDANVTFMNCTVANNKSVGASGFMHWARCEQGNVNLKFVNNVFYKNRTEGPQANLITSQKPAPTVGMSGSFVFVNNTSMMNNTGVDGLVQTDQNAINFSDFGGDFDLVFVNNIMLDCMIEPIDKGDGTMVDPLGWGWSIREKDARSKGEYIIKNNLIDGVGGAYDATWGAGFLYHFNNEDIATANNNKSVRGKSTDQKLKQVGINRKLTEPTEGIPYIEINDPEGYAIDNGVSSLIYKGEELIPQTDIRGVAKTGNSRDLGAFEYNGVVSSVNEFKVDSQVHVYLNHLTGILYFSEEVASVQMYTSFGMPCIPSAVNVTSVNIQNLEKGIYIVRIVDKNGKVYSEKILK